MTSLTSLLFSYLVVPVIVIITKFDAMDDKAFMKLRKEGLTRDEARDKAPRHAVTIFGQEIKDILYKYKYPPKGHVLLRGKPTHNMMIKLILVADMDHNNAACDELIACTANAIDNKSLKLLFVSIQGSNLALCMKIAVDELVCLFYYLVTHADLSLALD